MNKILKTRWTKGLVWLLIFAFINLAMPAPWLPQAQATTVTVSSVTPTTGSVGTAITIFGSGFDTYTAGISKVQVGGVDQLTITSWTNSKIICTVPMDAASSGIRVYDKDGHFNATAKAFTINTPIISMLSPSSGVVGTPVTVTGNYFGALQGQSVVRFSGVDAAGPYSWSNTSIICQVPPGVSGSVAVQVIYVAASKTSASKTFVVPSAAITSISPGNGVAGDSVTLLGNNFGAAAGQVIFTDNVVSPTYTSWDNTRIVCVVPAGVSTGYVAAVDATCSPKAYFSVAAPIISSLDRYIGATGELLTITGTNFGYLPGTSAVYFYNGQIAELIQGGWSNTQIVCRIPAGATTGGVKVHTGGGDSNSPYFTVLGISAFAPSNGVVGTEVTISGTGFGTGATGSSVTIAGSTITVPNADILTWIDNQVKIKVPPSAAHAVDTISVYNATSLRTFTTTSNFTINAPSLTSASAQQGKAGDILTLYGSNFGAAEGTVTLLGVHFGGVKATVSAGNWTDTRIICPIPAGALTGVMDVTTAGGFSTLTFVAAPLIASITPGNGVAGDLVTITGTGFGTPMGDSTLTFNGQLAADIPLWDDTQIQVYLPDTAGTGPVVVTRVYMGITAPGVAYTYTYGTPAITELQPNYGRSGDTVTITGSNFGHTRGSSTVTFNGAPVETGDPSDYLSWNNTSIVVNVPDAGSTGNVVVHTGGGNSNGALFTYQPFISSIDPTKGVNGTLVKITGDHFGTNANAGKVYFFDNQEAAIESGSWTDTQVIAIVPAGVQTGPVKLTVNGAPSNEDVIFTVNTPFIGNITPGHGPVGATVTIDGHNFGATQDGSTFSFNGTDAGTATSWSNTQVVINVPAGAETGNVTITTAGGSFDYTQFYLDPLVNTLDPTHGVAGTYVTILGGHFGDTQGTGTVSFNGVDASGNVDFWSMTEIRAYAPADVTTGPVVVTVEGFASNDTVSWTVDAPMLDGDPALVPNFGNPGDTITLNGHNFGSEQGSTGHVFFSGTEANVYNWSDTAIEVEAPSAASGPVVVQTSGGSSTENPIFTFAPIVNSITPDTLAAGYEVTIDGLNFGNSQGESSVSFNGVDAATYVSWNVTQIVVTAPADVESGDLVVQTAWGDSNGYGYTVAQPSLNDISPLNGVAGDAVTLFGQYFGTTQGSSTVQFNGAQAETYDSWSDTQVVVRVPAGAATGDLYLNTYGGGDSEALTFTYNPNITALTPTHGDRGMALTITGDHFTDDPGSFFGMVTFNDGALDSGGWSSWSDTEIILNVPDGAITGNVNVSLNVFSSNGETFTLDVPAISGTEPIDGVTGDLITIYGESFGVQFGDLPPADAFVTFYNGVVPQQADYVSWDSTMIVVAIPPDTESGGLTVTTAGGTSAPFEFAIRPPQINGDPQLDPSHGSAGAYLTINGTDFGTSQGNLGSVTVNGVPVDAYNYWDNTRIEVTVPDTETGIVVVHTGGGDSTENPIFTYDPAITNATPEPLASGYLVTIEGSHFGNGGASAGKPEGAPGQPGADIVTFNGVEASGYALWSNTRIEAYAPADVTSGNIVVLNGGESNPWPYSVGTPQLSGLNPDHGVTGDQLTLTGQYFGTPQGSSVVHFNGADASSYEWSSDTQILVTVPEGAMTGEVTLETAGGGMSTPVLFTYTPHISALSPDTADWGAEITITGDHFTDNPGQYNGIVTFFDGLPANFTTWNDSEIVVTVPVGAQTGAVTVSISGYPSNEVTFTLASPVADTLDPDNGVVGDTVIIYGGNFGSEQGPSYVTFYNGKQAVDYPSWSNTMIQVVVPPDTESGDVTVTTPGGTSGPLGFTVRPPSINGSPQLDPDNGLAGDTVIINGTDFGSAQGATGWVQFNGVPAGVQKWYTDHIVVTAPDTVTGAVVVHTNGGDSTENPTFTYLPFILQINPVQGQYGDTFTLTGGNFGDQGGNGAVLFGGPWGQSANISSWNNTEIVGEVPEGAGETPVIVHTDLGYDSDAVPFTYFEPVLNSLEPEHGLADGALTLHGQYFGKDSGQEGLVQFNGVNAAIQEWGGDGSYIVVTIPDSETGDVFVHTFAGDSNPLTFTYDPVLESLSPGGGVNGDLITIGGRHFGDAQGASTVTFNGVEAPIDSWSNNTIYAFVPVDAPTGDVIITVNGVPSNPLPFLIVQPQIANLNPDSGVVGDAITINAIAGYFFGAQQGTTGHVYFDGTEIPVNWGNESIQFTVPDWVISANPEIYVVTAGGESNRINLSILRPDDSGGISPNQGVVGTEVTITGANFGQHRGDAGINYVEFSGGAGPQQVVDYLGWENNQIVVLAPPDISNICYVAVHTAGGVSDSNVFTILQPSINGTPQLDPDHGNTGDPVQINGSNFGSQPGTLGTVQFNGVPAGIVSWNDTQIVVNAPDSTNGPVVVHTGGGDTTENPEFTYIPQIFALNPNHGVYSDNFTVAGAHFGDSIDNLTFNGNDITGSVISWNTSEIVASVPQNIGSGDVVVTVRSYPSNPSFFAIDPPTIGALNPNSGSTGDTLTVFGANFGSAQGDTGIDYVQFNGVPAEVQSWNNSEIVVTVPDTETGYVIVHTIAGDSNGVLFTFVPHVDNIYPDHGYSGCYVVVSGSRFGFSGDPTLPPPDSGVTFNGVPALRYVYWSPTVIACVAPIDVSDGEVDVIVAGLHSATTQPFTVLQPQLGNIAPPHGVIGDTVALYGDNFGYFQGGTGFVTFNGVPAVNYMAWDNSQIVCQVPSGASYGDALVHTNGGDSNGFAFSFDAAVLDHALPNPAVVGDTVTIYGGGFGATLDTSYVTFYPGINSPSITAWSNSYAVCEVPPGAESGGLTITTAGGMSNNIDFIIAEPIINGLEPDTGAIGQTVTVHGGNFGAAIGPGCYVSFNGTHAPITAWNNDQIAVTVPPGATTGDVMVHNGGGDSNGWLFTVQEPQAPPQVPQAPIIESFTPDSGLPGDAVTITGINFGEAQGTSTVSFNGIDAGTAISWAEHQIIIQVPAGAGTGPVLLTVNAQLSNTDKIFTVNQ